MDYRDFSVKSKVIISLFQTVRLSLSIFTVFKFVLSLKSHTFARHFGIDDVTYSANVM